jgi:hypothetical protein
MKAVAGKNNMESQITNRYCPIETGFNIYFLMKNVINNCVYYQGKTLKVIFLAFVNTFFNF